MTNETRRGAIPTRDEVAVALTDIANSEPAMAAAYLFGSVARGHAGALSDIDVGVLARDPRDAPQICARTIDALARRLQTSRIDVVSLEASSMPLRYRAIRDGVLIVCRDAALVERFVADTVRHYLDFKPLRERAFQLMRAAILNNS